MGARPRAPSCSSGRRLVERTGSASNTKDHALLPTDTRGTGKLHRASSAEAKTQSCSAGVFLPLLALDLHTGAQPFCPSWQYRGLRETATDLVWSKLLVSLPRRRGTLGIDCSRNPGNGCGLNGNRCRPFDNATLAFRCPANCKAVRVLNPHAVGDQEINYQSLVIGGPAGSTGREPVYRGDSFICQAAIHSGLVGNDKGGCGVALLSGEQSNFTSTKRHGIQSIGFDSSFPKSFTFVSGLSSKCIRDLRWPLLAITCGFTTILSLCTTSPPVFFCSIFTMLFFHVGLVSDPPNHSDYASLTSLIIGRFLPAAFVAFVL